MRLSSRTQSFGAISHTKSGGHRRPIPGSHLWAHSRRIFLGRVISTPNCVGALSNTLFPWRYDRGIWGGRATLSRALARGALKYTLTRGPTPPKNRCSNLWPPSSPHKKGGELPHPPREKRLLRGPPLSTGGRSRQTPRNSQQTSLGARNQRQLGASNPTRRTPRTGASSSRGRDPQILEGE